MISQRIIKRAQQTKLTQAKEEALERTTGQLRQRDEAVANAERCAYIESIFLATKLNQKNMMGQMKEREIENEYKLEIPSARFANPKEIASATCFLCSNEASYINGINLPVDGGYSVTL